MKRATLWGLLAVLASVVAQADANGPNCCHQCGCAQARKVCRLVPTTTKTTTFCYGLECDDFCINGRSRCVGTQKVCDCHGSHCEKIMQPTCCRIDTRRLLTKTPVVKEKCGWKCVVETVCGGCGNCCASRDATDAETALATAAVEKQGIIPASATEEIMMPLADEPSAESAQRTATKKTWLQSLFNK